jgi:phospholipase C
MRSLKKWALGTACCGIVWWAGCSGTSASNSHSSSAAQVQLSVALTGSGGGIVTSSPPGISCGQTCSAAFNMGTTVTLTANAVSGGTFAGWSGACTGTTSCSLTLNGPSMVKATFNSPSPGSVQLSVSETGSGTVTSSPPGINCPQTCSASFTSGSAVTLTAAAGTGEIFSGWSGACSGTRTCTLTLSSAAVVTATFMSPSQSINHIIFMLQENRGFDHYFGHLPQYLQANGYSQTVEGEPANASNPSFPNGQTTISAFHLLTQCVESITPSWDFAHTSYNLGSPASATATLDGFVHAAASGTATSYHDTQGIRAMGYYDSSDLPYYYFMAANFGTSDRWFSPVLSRTQPNRMYLLAATSAGHTDPLPAGAPQLHNSTIFDLLQKAGISWRVYVTDNASPLYLGSALNMFETSTKYPQNFVPASQFDADATNGTLPQVAMIEPGYDSGLDEHPTVTPNQLGGGIQVGSHYVSTLINALMHSPSWQDSVFILSYDEDGGFYDHVAPMQTVNPDGIPPSDLASNDICYGNTGGNCDFNYTGFRVPLLVISPFTKNYVSHTPADYTAILKLIETRFNLPSLTKRDAAQMDMMEFFDFVNVPWKTAPTPPLQPTNGDPCYLDHLP